MFGLKKVVLEGAELLTPRRAIPTRSRSTRRARRTTGSRTIYHHPSRSYYGIALLVVAYLVLFGVPGITA